MSDVLSGFFAGGRADQRNTMFQQGILARDQERQDAEFAQQLVEQAVKQGKSLSDLAKTLIENSPDPASIPRDTLAGIGATVEDLASALERKSPTDALALRQTFATVLGSSKTLAQQAQQAGKGKAIEKGAEVEGLSQIPGADRTAVLRDQGLQEKPQTVSAADSRPKPQNFQLPDGSYTSVDLNSPAGAARARELIDQGAVAVGVAVQAGEGGVLKPPGSAESAAIRDLEGTTLNILSETANLREQLASGDVFTSLAGGVLGTLASAAGNIQQAAELAGVETPSLTPEGYDFSKFEERAGSSAAFKSNAINLAYLLARASDPGGRVSDKDLQAQLDRIGANAGNRAGMLKVLDEVDRGTITNFQNRRGVLEAGSQGSLPPVSDPRLAGGGRNGGGGGGSTGGAQTMTAETVASMPAATLRSRIESMSVQELDALAPQVRAAIAAKLRGGQ